MFALESRDGGKRSDGCWWLVLTRPQQDTRSQAGQAWPGTPLTTCTGNSLKLAS